MDVFLTIIAAWFVTVPLQILAVPFLIPRFKDHLIDGGWAFGRLFMWLFLGLPIWLLANFKLPVNTVWGLGLMIGIVFMLSFRNFRQRASEIIGFLAERWPVIVADEIIFAIGFFFLSIVRAFGPDIIDLEKFMDVGLMASYLRSPTLPVADMWFAGASMNYYSFGHFLGALMTRVWGWLPLVYSYNLLLGLIMGLFLVQSFSLIMNLLGKFPTSKEPLWPRVFGGVIGSVLIIFGGNSHTIWYGIKNHGWKGYWYPDATRFIENTIHEFPCYGFIVSDLHAHIWDLPIVILLLVLTFIWYRQVLTQAKSMMICLKAVGVGGVWGVAIMTNAWDGAIYALFLSLCGVSLLMSVPRRWKEILLSGFIIIGTGVGLSASWWRNFDPISKGFRWVEAGSPFWQLLVLWTSFVLLSGLAFFIADNQLRKLLLVSQEEREQQKPTLTFLLCLIVTAWILIVLPELIYIKDIYPGHPRANTMFKFTLQAFILMGLVSGWVSGYVLRSDFIKGRRGGKVGQGILLAVILGISLTQMIYPFFAYRERFEGFRKFKGLNGLNWMKKQYPEDYEAIQWLNQTVVGQPIILEAVGTSYSTFSRVSAFTGIPTVVGWPVHEWLWRGSYEIPGPRVEQVKKMYEVPYSPEAAGYFERYRVEYIFVGSKEYEAYPLLDVAALRGLGPVVFEKGKTFIIHRNGSYFAAPVIGPAR